MEEQRLETLRASSILFKALMHVWREKKELESIAGLSCTDRSSHTQPEEREAGSKLPSLKDEQREETLGQATFSQR